MASSTVHAYQLFSFSSQNEILNNGGDLTAEPLNSRLVSGCMGGCGREEGREGRGERREGREREIKREGEGGGKRDQTGQSGGVRTRERGGERAKRDK